MLLLLLLLLPSHVQEAVEATAAELDELREENHTLSASLQSLWAGFQQQTLRFTQLQLQLSASRGPQVRGAFDA